MNVVYRGKTIAGSFQPDSQVSLGTESHIIEKDGDLYLCDKTMQTRLAPADAGAKEILDLFDNDPINNSSLYEMAMNGDYISLVFHRFPRPVQKLINPKKGQLYFYFESGLVAKEQAESGLDENGLIQQIRKDCVHQGSIFLIFDKETFSRLYVIGDDKRYRAIEERPGLFRIQGIYPGARNLPADQILQIFKGFDFLTWQDSLSIASQEVTQLSNVGIPDMIKAWDNYIEFLKADTKKKQKEYGLLSYDSIDFSSGEPIIHVSSPSSLHSSPLIVEGVELDAVSDDITDPDGKPMSSYYLGKPKRVNEDRGLLTFKTQDLTNSMKRLGSMTNGKLRYSSFSMDVESERRKKVFNALQDNTNMTSKNISRLMDPKILDTALPTNEKPVTEKSLKTMFGADATTVVLSETYREAINIALNTPDIALIQGPPGTGKTTLIRGVMARISAIDPNAKILLTAEQHDALDNAVSGVKSSLPPIVASKRFDSSPEEETQRLEKTIETFRSSLITRCDSLLSSSTGSSNVKKAEKAVFFIQKIRESDFDKTMTKEELPNLRDALMDIGVLNDCSSELAILDSMASIKPAPDTTSDPLLKRINAQRTTKESWADDGKAQLDRLQEALEFEGHKELMLQNGLVDELLSSPSDSTFQKYQDAVQKIRDTLYPQKSSFVETPYDRSKKALDSIRSKIVSKGHSLPRTIDDIIGEFKEKVIDPENVLDLVKNYSTIVASTCAQATKIVRYSSIASDRAKYVVVDEAARVNPLDLLNAIMMGVKIILVGDQKQLPQYLEAQAVARYEKNGGTLAQSYSDLLDKSLFGALYENLDKAYKEGRIKARRTIMLDEQHRMNPIIGDFVSNEFYQDQGGIRSPEEMKKKTNDFKIFDGKNVAFVDIPVIKGKEDGVAGGSTFRTVEIEEVLKIMAEIYKNNPGQQPNIGVLSFYGEQKARIEAGAKERFSSEQLANVEFGTVDSFQGKEFDIVLLSCVRSNGADNARKAVGFLYESPNRINVALSRAKRLLALIGDSETISKSEPLKHFVQYAKEKGYYGKR